MRMLTDDPTRAGRVAARQGWVEVPPEELRDFDRELWSALAQGIAPWTLQEDHSPDRFWNTLALITDAPASQFDRLQEILRSGVTLPGPVACLALTGREFHGHRGRHWAVAEGNLHLSAAFAPGKRAAELGMALNMLPAVAAADAVRAATGGAVDPGIKWVNDLLVDGRKIGGVLAASQTRGDRVESAVLGIGLNIVRAPRIEPTPFVPRSGCLHDLPGGENVDLSRVCFAVLMALAERYDRVMESGPGELLEEYRRRSAILGRRVRIWEDSTGERGENDRPPPIATGIVREIGPDLSLRIEGRDEPVTKGRLAFEEACLNRGP